MVELHWEGFATNRANSSSLSGISFNLVIFGEIALLGGKGNWHTEATEGRILVFYCVIFFFNVFGAYQSINLSVLFTFSEAILCFWQNWLIVLLHVYDRGGGGESIDHNYL